MLLIRVVFFLVFYLERAHVMCNVKHLQKKPDL